MGLNIGTSCDLLADLNDKQSQAVSLGFGPALIVAGAGSGKTTVLTRRAAYLLSELGQNPSSIMAVTFTNKAAGEMSRRLTQLIGYDVAKRLWIGTFHSICARLLRREIELFCSPEGYCWKSNFVIYDETDSLSLVKNAVKSLNLDEKVFPPRDMRRKISGLKNDGFAASSYASAVRNYRDTRIAEIYTNYQAQLARNNALDFDDLLMVFVELLKQNPEVLARQHQYFQHLLVDEFQDTNLTQYELVRLITTGITTTPHNPPLTLDWANRSLMVVGDVDQSIYSWRKADFRIILGFQDDFANSTLIKLEENYRSTGTILEIANSIISNNSERIEKVLRSNRSLGSKAQCYEAMDEIDESFYVVEELKKIRLRGKNLAQVVILYRTNAQSRAIEELLVRNNIPYTMVGATRFYERQEIKDIIAYLKLVYNGQDGQALLRIINQPRRGLGKTTIERLAQYALDNNLSSLEASAAAKLITGISAKTAKTLEEFASLVKRWQMLSSVVSVSELIENILSDSHYIEKLEEEVTAKTDPLAGGRIENIQEFLAVARDFENTADNPSLEQFLTRISLVSDLDAVALDQDAVKLMTMHSAKGLEFSVVFLMGLEEGLFPHIRSLDSPSALEEERRLMYVGVTRAADSLYLTYARKRMSFHNSGVTSNFAIPSRFLQEIDSNLLSGYYPHPHSYGSKPTNPIDIDDPAMQWANTESGFARRSEKLHSNSNDIKHNTYASYTNLPPKSQKPYPQSSKPQSGTSTTNSYGATTDNTTYPKLKVNDTVQHTKFGIGVICQIIGEGDKEIYNVEFQAFGKRLLDPRFAKLTKLS